MNKWGIPYYPTLFLNPNTANQWVDKSLFKDEDDGASYYDIPDAVQRAKDHPAAKFTLERVWISSGQQHYLSCLDELQPAEFTVTSAGQSMLELKNMSHAMRCINYHPNCLGNEKHRMHTLPRYIRLKGVKLVKGFDRTGAALIRPTGPLRKGDGAQTSMGCRMARYKLVFEQTQGSNNSCLFQMVPRV